MSTKTVASKSLEISVRPLSKPEQLKGFMGFSPEFLMQQNWYCRVLRKVRRSYLSVFHKSYVQTAIQASRKGDCNRCGACCEILYKCPFLGRDSKDLPFCRIYGELRPASCKTYPFDKVDADIEQCSYTFH